MEEARHWVWAKRKHGLISATNSHAQLHGGAPNKSSSYDESWEEQAFAEDAAGSLLGGCVWPPRSYSCSFCRREFRSAQALGGHMNVHRRDRARLKQSPPDQLHREILNQNNHDHLNNSLNNNNINNIPFHQNINVSPLMVTTINSTASQNIPQFPSQVCALVYNPNPNTVSDIFSSPPSQVCEENYEKQALFPLDKESSDRQVLFNPSSQIFSRSNSGTMDRCYQMKELREDQKVSSLTVESGGSCRAKSRDYHHHVKAHDLSVSLNLVVCRSCPSSLSSGYNIKEDCDHSVSTCKRRRIVYEEEPCSSQLISVDDHNPAILKQSSGNNQHHQQDFLQKEVLNQHNPFSIKEELDLELRLGTRTP